MTANCELSPDLVDRLRRDPIHEVMSELGQEALDADIHTLPEFKKLCGYLLERSDGRDRRESLANRNGTARPVPRLRLQMESCFGGNADLPWFRLNKTVNASKMPLIGPFARIAAGLARVKGPDFGAVIDALLCPFPDASILRLLQQRGGKLPGFRLELFSRVAYIFRRDLYFLVPRRWGESSGCIEFIGDDLRKYIALCRTFRQAADKLGISQDIRGSIFYAAMEQDPINETLLTLVNRQIGNSIAHAGVLAPKDGYIARSKHDPQATMPLEFTSTSIRARRGEKQLRDELLGMYGGTCTMSGTCLPDLLEVAHLVPFPANGDVNSTYNAILLRSDLHTLWDLNHIGVHPETLTLHIADILKGTIYEKLTERTLAARKEGPRLAQQALEERWSHFQSGLKRAHGKGRKTRKKKADTTPAAEARTTASRSDRGRVDSSGSQAGMLVNVDRSEDLLPVHRRPADAPTTE